MGIKIYTFSESQARELGTLIGNVIMSIICVIAWVRRNA